MANYTGYKDLYLGKKDAQLTPLYLTVFFETDYSKCLYFGEIITTYEVNDNNIVDALKDVLSNKGESIPLHGNVASAIAVGLEPSSDKSKFVFRRTTSDFETNLTSYNFSQKGVGMSTWRVRSCNLIN